MGYSRSKSTSTVRTSVGKCVDSSGRKTKTTYTFSFCGTFFSLLPPACSCHTRVALLGNRHVDAADLLLLMPLATGIVPFASSCWKLAKTMTKEGVFLHRFFR